MRVIYGGCSYRRRWIISYTGTEGNHKIRTLTRDCIDVRAKGTSGMLTPCYFRFVAWLFSHPVLFVLFDTGVCFGQGPIALGVPKSWRYNRLTVGNWQLESRGMLFSANSRDHNHTTFRLWQDHIYRLSQITALI